MLSYSRFATFRLETEFKVIIQRARQWGSLLFMGCGLLVGFVIGRKGRGQFRISPNAEVKKSYLQETGDAPDAVRAEVLSSLQESQSGYSKRHTRSS